VTGWNIILLLKVAVSAVTVLLLASFVPLARGNYRLHGRINMAFATLTFAALFGLELVVRVIDPRVFDYLDGEARRNLQIHLCFSVPAAVMLPAMLLTGLTHRRRTHLTLAAIFGFFWLGTFLTGVLLLPHAPPS
jgi:uncharacterized membrane protein YozB (DUF420 family)